MLARLADAVERNLSTARAAVAIVAVGGLLRLAFVPFGAVLREDAFAYVVKAGEIARGNLVPMSSHAIGWPLALAPFVGLAGRTPIDGGMDVARAVTLVASLAVLWLTGRLAHSLLDRTSANVALAFTAVSAVLVYSASAGMAEPLFTVLLLAAVLEMGRASRLASFPWRTGLWLGLAWWVRPHAIIAAAGVFAAVAIDRREGERRAAPLCRAGAVLLIACFAAAPVAYQRYAAFGSPLTFGANDKYLLAAKKEHVWSANVAPVSLREFVQSLTPAVVVDRLLVHGFGRVALHVGVYVVTPLLLPFLVLAVQRRLGDARFRPPIAVLATWVAAVVPLASASMRHLLPIAPLAFLLAADGFVEALRRPRWRPFAAAALVGFILHSLAAAAWYRQADASAAIRDGLTWGTWAADHIRGRLAIVEGGDLVMMHLPDTAVAGVGLTDFYAPRTGLRVTRPGWFDSLEEAMAWMRGQGITHLAVDDDGVRRRPYLQRVRDPRTGPSCIEPIAAGTFADSAWPIQLFHIRWAECGGGVTGLK